MTAQWGLKIQKRKKITLYFWVICLILLIAALLVWLFYFKHIEYTNDAYVQGNQTYITPLHPGFVTSIQTDDSFLVKEGQLIVTLDQTDAKIALEQAQENLAQTVRTVCELFHQVFVYKMEIELKKAELIRDIQDYFHREEVVLEQGVSIEEYEHALAALRAQYASLEMSGALYHRSLAAVRSTSIYNHPLVISACDSVRDAWVYLYRCNIYSPVEGLVAQRTIQVGMWTPAGQPLMSVIPLDQIWVNANYKETQLKSIRLGQNVDIIADLWGMKHVFHGTVVGLPGGAGNVFSLLPPQNLSGNWIKIVQRLPVRIALDPKEFLQFPLRLGLSCKAIVDIRDKGGKMVPDTTVGSPHYQTSIFQLEEIGDRELMDTIIANNLDPQLTEYAKQPLELPELILEFQPLLEEAYIMDCTIKNAIFKDKGP